MAHNIEERPIFSKQSSPLNSQESYFWYRRNIILLCQNYNYKNEHIQQVNVNIY